MSDMQDEVTSSNNSDGVWKSYWNLHPLRLLQQIIVLRKAQVARKVTYREDAPYGKSYSHWNEKTAIFVRIPFEASSEI